MSDEMRAATEQQLTQDASFLLSHYTESLPSAAAVYLQAKLKEARNQAAQQTTTPQADTDHAFVHGRMLRGGSERGYGPMILIQQADDSLWLKRLTDETQWADLKKADRYPAVVAADEKLRVTSCQFAQPRERSPSLIVSATNPGYDGSSWQVEQLQLRKLKFDDAATAKQWKAKLEGLASAPAQQLPGDGLDLDLTCWLMAAQLFRSQELRISSSLLGVRNGTLAIDGNRQYTPVLAVRDELAVLLSCSVMKAVVYPHVQDESKLFGYQLPDFFTNRAFKTAAAEITPELDRGVEAALKPMEEATAALCRAMMAVLDRLLPLLLRGIAELKQRLQDDPAATASHESKMAKAKVWLKEKIATSAAQSSNTSLVNDTSMNSMAEGSVLKLLLEMADEATA